MLISFNQFKNDDFFFIDNVRKYMMFVLNRQKQKFLYRHNLKQFKNSNDLNSIENIIKFVIDFVDANNAKNKIIFDVYEKNNDEIEIFNFRIALMLKSKKKFNDDFHNNDFFVNENDDDKFIKNIDIDKKMTKTMKTNK